MLRQALRGAVQCHAKAALRGNETGDAACIAAAEAKYDSCTTAALGRGGCTIDQTGTSHLKDEIVNTWAADVAADTPLQ